MLPFTLRILQHTNRLNLKFRAKFREIPSFLFWHNERFHFRFLKLLLNFNLKLSQFNFNFRIDKSLLLQRSTCQGNFVSVLQSLAIVWINLFNSNWEISFIIVRFRNIIWLFSLLILWTCLYRILKQWFNIFHCLL